MGNADDFGRVRAKKGRLTFVGHLRWIAESPIPQSQERPVGTIDVDLALNHKELTEARYRVIVETLLVAWLVETEDRYGGSISAKSEDGHKRCRRRGVRGSGPGGEAKGRLRNSLMPAGNGLSGGWV